MTRRKTIVFLCVIFTMTCAAGVSADQRLAKTEEGTETAVPPSEMQSVLERYSVDRSALLRSRPIDLSPARRNRMKDFYLQWQQTLAKVNFEAMSQPGQVPVTEYYWRKN